MAGFAHAAMALGGSYSLALLHLRHMNPYVVTSMKVTGEPRDAARTLCISIVTAVCGSIHDQYRPSAVHAPLHD